MRGNMPSAHSVWEYNGRKPQSWLLLLFKYKTKCWQLSWLKNCKLHILIGLWQCPHHSLLTYYFHTHKFVADLVLHLQCIDIQKATITQHVHTHTHAHTRVQRYQRGARQNDSKPEKKLGQNKKEIQICLPCWNPRHMEKDWHWIQKYHNFYISKCLYWLLFRNTLNLRENLLAKRIMLFKFFLF